MRTRDTEIIEIGECRSLHCVIDRLQMLRCSLSEDAEAQVKVDGDENFGWRLTVTYYRELTPEEAALDAKYRSAARRRMGRGRLPRVRRTPAD